MENAPNPRNTPGATARRNEGRRRIRIGNRSFGLPGSPAARITVGIALVVGGLLGFLPVIGFWMLPLGIMVLAVDLKTVRAWRRRFDVWLGRRLKSGKAGTNKSDRSA